MIEYWHDGEYRVLKNKLKGATHFNPLFIRNEDGGISVYYDVNNEDTALQPLIDFIQNNPQEFFRLANKYASDHSHFAELVVKPSLGNLNKIFDLLREMWGFMPVLVQIGELGNSELDSEITERASELRTISQEKDAQAEGVYREIIKQHYPEYYEFWDALCLKEILDNSFPSNDELKKRQRGFIFFEGKLILDKSKEEFQKEYFVKIDDTIQVIGQEQQSNQLESQIVKGNVAYPGVVRGKIKIILSKEEMGDIEDGEILVTAMTTPEFMPAIRKAAAFVTDEGGITSHAAIVARELKKPCIIGTRVATQVLKSDDFVEVDAENGLIRILQ